MPDRSKPRVKMPAPPVRAAGQGAREKLNELSKHASLFGKVAQVFGFDPEYENWKMGEAAERRVGSILAKLRPSEWRVENDLYLSANWNIDHVVYGRGGVFLLDTKCRSGRVSVGRGGIKVNGRRSEIPEKIKDAARELSGILLREAGVRCWVQPVVVFDRTDATHYDDPEGLAVIDSSELLAAFAAATSPEIGGRDVLAIERALGLLRR